MNRRHPVDPVGGRAFFRDTALFVCALAPPYPDDATRWTVLAFAAGPAPARDAYAEALELARNIGGRHYSMLVEPLALGTDAWPDVEPEQAAQYVIERDGFVVLAPSIEGWVSMPPARPHHVVRLVAVEPRGGEAAARAALAALGTCGLMGRVRAVLHCDSGAELDAVVCGAKGLQGGYFVEPPVIARADIPAEPSPRDVPLPPDASWPPTEASERSVVLNQALAAYLQTSTSQQRLDTWLRPHGLTIARTEIQALLDAAIATTDEHLWAQTPGVRWSESFEQQLFEHLVARHPWLESGGCASLLGHARWLCWHEGLNAPE